MPSLRFADPLTVTQYPLEISSAAEWRAEGDAWAVSIDLGPLPAGEMIAPSLSVPEAPRHGFVFTLEADGETYALAEVPPPTEPEAIHAAKKKMDGAGRKRKVRTAIDCFHVERPVRTARLHCRLTGTGEPERYLLTVSVRPTEIDPVPDDQSLPDVMARRPAAISQMLQNPRIASRVCSPVSTAMVMGAHRRNPVTEQIIAECHDTLTGMYGLWPLAVRSAALAGSVGAVELFAGWEPVLACLSAGLPLVASIRYGAGELPGAPMTATGGHLVVVYGVTGGEVLIHDPAAPTHGSVMRRYPLAAFSRAWFRHRGAVYILCP